MPPKSSNDKSAYKSKIKLDSEKLKNGEIQAAKVDLSKINLKKSKINRCVKRRYKIVYVPIHFKEVLCFK